MIFLYKKKNKLIVSNFPNLEKKLYGSFFMDGVQLSQGYRATTRRQFTFYHSVLGSSWYPTDRPRKDERLSWPCWSHQVLNPRPPLDWEFIALTTGCCFRLFHGCHYNIPLILEYVISAGMFTTEILLGKGTIN